MGAHLFESQNGKLPIIGVAKTYFEGCEDYRTVYRGNSVKPLYVSSIGIDLDCAAKLIKGLGGTHRIPDMLRRVDHLTKS